MANEVWEVHSRVEYSVVLLKLHLREERPGVFRRVPAVKAEQRDLVVQSRHFVEKALTDLQANRLGEALEAARCSRDRLRALLKSVGARPRS